MELSRLEKFYRVHSKFYDATRWLYLLDRKKAIDLLKIESGDTVIDFGCGTGLNIPYLVRNDVEIIGIDYSESMLRRAKSKFPYIRFIKGDISSHKFSKAASKIICTYALSMVEDWERAVLNMKRTLHKNGVMVILDFEPFKGILKFLNPAFGWWLNKHGVDIEQQLVSFLQKHFAQVEVKVRPYGYNYIAVARQIK